MHGETVKFTNVLLIVCRGKFKILCTCEVVLPLARNYLKEPRIGMDHESYVLEILMIMMKELYTLSPSLCLRISQEIFIRSIFIVIIIRAGS